MSATILRPDAVLLRPGVARAVFVGALLAGAMAGLAVGGHASAAAADPELTRLLRAMAALKLLFVAAAAAAVLWRLQAPARPALLAGYAASAAAMTAGPGLIWFASHIVLASVLMHGGLAASLLLLWRDGACGKLLEQALHARRARGRG